MNCFDYVQFIRATGEKTAFRFLSGGEETAVSGAQWAQDVCAFAAWLREQGFREKNLGLATKNCYEWFVALFAMMLTENTAVSLNYGLPAEDLRSQMELTGLAAVFIKENSELDGEDLSGAERVIDLNQALEQARKLPAQEPDFVCDMDRPALILFSSGTSGVPKGVMLSQRNLMSILDKRPNRIHAGDYLLSLPLYHISGVYFGILYLYSGMTVCICEEIKYLLRDISRFKPTLLAMVPAHIDFLANQCKRKKALSAVLREHTRAVVSLGAPLLDEHGEVFGALDVQILDVYGLTESTGAVCEWYPHKKGALGRPSAKLEYRIVEGELQIRGSCVMMGYYQNEEATREMLRDGWLCTGDLVEQDSEGYLILKGRKKNVIILSNGENVSPEVLEQKLLALGAAEELIVSGRDDMILAEFYLGEGDSETAREDWKQRVEELNHRLPTYQKIQRVEFRTEPFPKTGSGKIKRHL